jgi:hypothetical protein
LMIRSSRNFETVLKKMLDKSHPQSSEGRDLFTEAMVHFWQRFIWRSRGQDGRFLKPARFKVSTPLEWPAREPEASCFSFMGRCPVEIRYWVDNETH